MLAKHDDLEETRKLPVIPDDEGIPEDEDLESDTMDEEDDAEESNEMDEEDDEQESTTLDDEP